MATYRISNNTDLAEHPFETRNRREAERQWRRVKPGKNAGNLYAASYSTQCETCGGWQDMTVDYVTCACH